MAATLHLETVLLIAIGSCFDSKSTARTTLAVSRIRVTADRNTTIPDGNNNHHNDDDQQNRPDASQRHISAAIFAWTLLVMLKMITTKTQPQN
jgi:hypothetical protein